MKSGPMCKEARQSEIICDLVSCKHDSVREIEVMGETWWDTQLTDLSFYALYVFIFTATGRNVNLSATRHVTSHDDVTALRPSEPEVKQMGQ